MSAPFFDACWQVVEQGTEVCSNLVKTLFAVVDWLVGTNLRPLFHAQSVAVQFECDDKNSPLFCGFTVVYFFATWGNVGFS